MNNMQRVYDEILNHLRTQGVCSVANDGGCCMYRGPEGKKCAIGLYISDADYNNVATRVAGSRSAIEGLMVSDRIIFNMLPAYVRSTGLDFLTKMQQMHDLLMDLEGEQFLIQLEELAKTNASIFGLVYTPPV